MKRIERRIAVIGMIALMVGTTHAPSAHAAPLNLSDVPLFVDLGVEPNVVLSMDSSGSMARCFVTPGGQDTTDVPAVFDEYDPVNLRGTAFWGVASAQINGLYYDPTIQYPIPVDGTGTPLNDSDQTTFTNAYIDGYNPGAGRLNLSISGPGVGFRPCWYNLGSFVDPYNPGVAPNAPPTPVGQPAYYLEYDGTGDITLETSFTKRVIGQASDPSFSGDAAKQENNFAVWFSYYRNRLNVMKAAAGLAAADPSLDGKIRVAHQNLWGLNGSSGTRQDVSLMRLYTGQARVDFYTWLYALTTSGNTPLRYTLDKVGKYFQNQKIDGTAAGHGYVAMTAVDSPWALEPGVTQVPEFTCRQAFHVLFTDGLWNADAGVTGNVDGSSSNYGAPGAVALPSGATSYSPGPPYTDANNDTLADNAFKYWVTDLRPDLTNDVAPFLPDLTPHPVTGKIEDNPKNDPATWQHLVNFTVSFGLDGALSFDDTTYNQLLNGTAQWSTNEVDDLWHAALNSRGQYLRAQNPKDLVDAFNTAITSVLSRTSSGAAAALNSGTLDANSRLYQARFNSGTWSGQLLAFDINADGTVQTPEAWDGGALLTTQVANNGWDVGRHVITFNGTPATGGIPFRWASLPAAMQAELNKNAQGVADAVGAEQGQARLEYLRGSSANEGTGNDYRVRSGKLGDIVNGAPAFVGTPTFDYPDTLETQPYSSFKAANTSPAGRTPVVYAGANDGMLHAFNADTGAELFAYVPQIVFPNLTRLTASPYAHRFFVDGPPTVGDVFYNNAWHTVLVGGLRKGAQGLYALDVTNPGNFNETNAAALVRWEFSDADLGYTYSRPAIARMYNGRWAAVVGNGYNNTEPDGSASATGNAVLYVLDVENGSVIKKLDTGVGTSADPAASGRPNGLATASPVDVNGDRIVDYIYAGDLFGNLWKFDVRASDPALWDIAYNGSPLFVALDGSGVRQPITTQPDIGLHPQFQSGSSFFNNGGYMIYFGSGKYLEKDDNIIASVQTQAFYGVWDPDRSTLPPAFDRSSLLQQVILEETSAIFGSSTFDLRLTSNNPINWRTDPLTLTSGDHLGWVLDLIVQGSGDNEGERQVTAPLLRNGRIIFTTLIPSGPSCTFGGSGFLMELDAANGARLSDPPFDFDNDGTFDLVNFAFLGTAGVPSGVRSTGGAPSAPSILDAGNGEEYKYLSGTDAGKLQAVHEKGGGGPPDDGTRESWRQLR